MSGLGHLMTSWLLIWWYVCHSPYIFVYIISASNINVLQSLQFFIDIYLYSCLQI